MNKQNKICSNSLVFTFSLFFIFLFSISLVSSLSWVEGTSNITTWTGNLTNLSEMQDVNIPLPSNGNLLTFHSSSLKWVAQDYINLTGNISFGKLLTFGFGEYIDNFVDGWLRVNGGLNVTQNLTVEEYATYKSYIAKYHLFNDTINSPDTAWHNITWNTNPDEETTDGFTLLSDNSTVQTNFNGIIRMSGYVNPVYNGGIDTSAEIMVRSVVNGVERRCAQASEQKQFLAGGISNLRFEGTSEVNIGDKLNVQYRVDDTDLDIEPNYNFDRPTAASVNYQIISRQG